MFNNDHVNGFKNTQELLASFVKAQYESASDENKPFWAQIADKNHININSDEEHVDLKTVVARVVYDPCTHKFLGYKVEDTDDVHINVGEDPFAYASKLFKKGYILVSAACYDYESDGKPLMIVFRFAAYLD